MNFCANRGLTCKMYGDSAAKVNSHQFSVRPPERASAWIFKRFSQTVSCWCPLQSAFAAESDLYGTFGSYKSVRSEKHTLEPPRAHSRPKIQRGTRCAYQFWPQSARSAASARGRPAAWPAAGQAARARARIQQNSARASSQISEFRSCMHEIMLHACTTGWTTTRIWTRLPDAAHPCK